MSTIHISEAEAVKDFAMVLAHVRAGSEVIIEGDVAPIAVLVPPADRTALPDARHDSWVRTQVQQAIDDPRIGIPEEEVEAYFAQRRAASLLRASGNPG